MEVLERPLPAGGGPSLPHAAATASKDAQDLFARGLALLHVYDWIGAARSFNAALGADPGLALARVGLSVAYAELGRDADARRALAPAQAAAAALPAHDRRHVEVRALQMLAEETPGDAARLRRYRDALDAANAEFPADVEFLLLRGMAESADPADRGQGSGASAAPYYERALARAPGHLAAHHYLAHAYENAGRPQEALTHAAAVARLAPGAAHARHMHGHALRRAGRVDLAIAEFEAADRLHREYAARERTPASYDWHFAHNLGLLATSLQYDGQMQRAEALLKAAFALPTRLLVQAFNKREWPMFLRGRGRYREAEAAARTLIDDPHPVLRATGHIETGFALLAQSRWGEAAQESNAALRLLRSAPGGAMAAPALLALQGEFNLRTAERSKGRAMLGEAAERLRALPGADAWSQALFELEAIARAAREVGDWEFAARMAARMIEHDPVYAGSHYALALAAEHDGDAATSAREFALAVVGWTRADADLPELGEARRKRP